MSLFNMSGKSALVTGAGSGIGAATAEALAAAGAKVFVTDRDHAAGLKVQQAILQAGGHAECFALDVTIEADVARVAEAVGAIDVLVNNAGIGHVGTALNTLPADLDRLYSVNVRGVLLVTRAFLQGMCDRRGGNIVNIASIGGLVGVRDRFAYCATKSALVGMTRCLALDHAAVGVRANCICPGRVRTPFVDARLAEYPDPIAALAEMSATQPLGRMATPQDVAGAVLYLASNAAAMVTGVALSVDGGWAAG